MSPPESDGPLLGDMGVVPVTATLNLVCDPGPSNSVLRVAQDWEDCHGLLDDLGVASDADATLVGRLKLVAERWLRSASAAGHPAGCQDKLCVTARKVLRFRAKSS